MAHPPGQPGAKPLDPPDPIRKGKPVTRHLNEQVEMVGHKAVGMKNDVLSLGVFRKEGKKRPIQNGIHESFPSLKSADSNKVAPRLRIIEALQAWGFSSLQRSSFHTLRRKERWKILP